MQFAPAAAHGAVQAGTGPQAMVADGATLSGSCLAIAAAVSSGGAPGSPRQLASVAGEAGWVSRGGGGPGRWLRAVACSHRLALDVGGELAHGWSPGCSRDARDVLHGISPTRLGSDRDGATVGGISPGAPTSANRGPGCPPLPRKGKGRSVSGGATTTSDCPRALTRRPRAAAPPCARCGGKLAPCPRPLAPARGTAHGHCQPPRCGAQCCPRAPFLATRAAPAHAHPGIRAARTVGRLSSNHHYCLVLWQHGRRGRSACD